MWTQHVAQVGPSSCGSCNVIILGFLVVFQVAVFHFSITIFHVMYKSGRDVEEARLFVHKLTNATACHRQQYCHPVPPTQTLVPRQKLKVNL